MGARTFVLGSLSGEQSPVEMDPSLRLWRMLRVIPEWDGTLRRRPRCRRRTRAPAGDRVVTQRFRPLQLLRHEVRDAGLYEPALPLYRSALESGDAAAARAHADTGLAQGQLKSYFEWCVTAPTAPCARGLRNSGYPSPLRSAASGRRRRDSLEAPVAGPPSELPCAWRSRAVPARPASRLENRLQCLSQAAE